MYDKQNNLKGKLADKLKSVELNFKNEFGEIPKSIMKFKKSDKLMALIDYDNSDIGKIDGDAKQRGGGFAKKLRYSIYNPDQAQFIIKYYTKENDLILDPFSGRATRAIISEHLNRRYIGFDVCKKTVELNNEILEKNNYKKSIIIEGDGCDIESYKSINGVDAVFTCPPYYGVEKYSGAIGDLSYMSVEQYDNKIFDLFKILSKIVKKSNLSEYEFHPVIFTVGTIRNGKHGIIDMDYKFQQFAKQNGFVLWDKIFTENLTPAAGFTFRRNYVFNFVTKNYETTLIFNHF